MKNALIVEDDLDSALMIKIALQDFDFESQIAIDFSSATEFLKNQQIDLIVSDWITSDSKTAREFIFERNEYDKQIIPLLIISGYHERKIKENFQDLEELKGVEFLLKPVNFEDLGGTLQKLNLKDL